VAVAANGTVYVADTNNNLIRQITPAGVVSTLAGSGSQGSANGTGLVASFNLPYGVAVAANGTIYVADRNNHLIRQITPAGVVSTLAGSGSQGSANGTGSAASFNSPCGVAVAANGTVYVADTNNNLIRQITPAGVVSTLAGSGSTGSANGTGSAASFNVPFGVAVAANGTVYVADTFNNRIRQITPAGVVSTLAGSGSYGNANGTGLAASFNTPCGVAVAANGTVYVADTNNNLIRQITPAGVVSTLAGSGSYSNDNAVGTSASFSAPGGVAVTADGTVYVADKGNRLVRVIK
jgi:serine/threonine protein kinase, bacterial